MSLEQYFHGPNAGYILEAYEKYQADSTSVDESLRVLFQHWQPDVTPSVNGTVAYTVPPADDNLVAGAANLANAIREFGHIAAQLDPLGTPPQGDPALELVAYGLNEADLRRLPSHIVAGIEAGSAWEAIGRLRRIYSHTTGYDYSHIAVPEERKWLREAAESRRYHPDNMPLDGKAMLKRLTQVEGFEQFLHRTFVGKKRFSIEGLDMMVPILDVILEEAAHGADQEEIHHILIGMAHRGRLNVLTHVLQKPYSEMLAEFKDIVQEHDDVNWTGDVKYHSGAVRTIEGNVPMTVQIADNPSHLELVNPVVEGMARAAGSTTGQRGMVRFDKQAVMPILIHGDAAFAGQGIVPETLNFGRLPGWRTGGTIHIIANNQIGFTTDYEEARSTLYASDVAKGYRIPIVHVNANDVEACVEVARTAFAYQAKFERDFLIDLVGYRRYGHNEGDEPRMTQPTMYQRVDALKTVRELWALELEKRGTISAGTAEQMWSDHAAEMQAEYEKLDVKPTQPTPFVPDKEVKEEIDTTVSAETLRSYNETIVAQPKGFKVNRKTKRVVKQRTQALVDADSAEIDWGHAEQLAFASILADGTPIRITGEDVERGTFSHRHAVLRDANTGERHIPLQTLPAANVAFECRNSPLSENAAIGFEYGYTLQAPDQLVLWEAQFGDFVNGAQPIIDEYVTSARAKWNQRSGLVLLLPHGYEGQGPDHSTARLERWLSMAADFNMRIVYPTTAAQYFHLLRRQTALLQLDPRPLIVMSPKSLLRNPLAQSSLNELATGAWRQVIDDPTMTDASRKDVQRLVLCSGKVYVDAMSSEHRPGEPTVALVRVEQLYRFPLDHIADILDNYPNINEVVWLQEEPQNGGAWTYAQPLLQRVIAGRWPLRYIGRPHRASPAEGSITWHRINQDNLMQQVYAD